jgi:hypothetical protein
MGKGPIFFIPSAMDHSPPFAKIPPNLAQKWRLGAASRGSFSRFFFGFPPFSLGFRRKGEGQNLPKRQSN